MAIGFVGQVPRLDPVLRQYALGKLAGQRQWIVGKITISSAVRSILCGPG